MSWRTITEADLFEQLTPGETAQLQNIAGSTQTAANRLGDSVRKFRGAIRAGGQDVDTTDGTIPDDVRDNVVDHARWQFLISFPQLKLLQTPERKEVFQEALKVLEALRKPGAFNVENPGDATADPSAAPSFGERGGSATNDPCARDFTRENQDG